VSGEDSERLAVPGPRGPQGRQGNQGNRGEQGTTGLSVDVRRALVFLFALSVILAGANLLWTAHEVHASQAAIQASQRREQAMQQQAGAILGQKLCTTFGKLAANKPPAGNPRTNPSRAYDQNQHAILDELGTDLGCK
jgi:hypothetical protein